MRKTAVAAALLLGVLASFAGDPPAPRRLHEDAEAMQRAMGAALDALLRNDANGTRAALDRIEAACRRIDQDAKADFGEKTVTFDLAFHRQLDLARELAARGDLEAFGPHFYGVIKGCRGCHLEAAGITFASPSGSGSPTPGSGSTPSR
ncbi:MAG TPA: hypothetical protein VF139_17195 [Candidatus Polarisedimenticolaceae bacterium]